MTTRPLGPLDAGWMMIESDVNHMHVGTLTIMRPPPDAGPGFLHRLIDNLRGYSVPAPPFNRRLVRSGLGWIWPVVEEVDRADMEHHLRHKALPWPGSEHELNTLVSQLHSVPLDMTQPPWEFHVIEGLEDGRFAVYIKMHHSLIDGVGSVRMAEAALSTDPNDSSTPPIWAAEGPPANSTSTGNNLWTADVSRWIGRATDQVLAGIDAARAALETFADARLPLVRHAGKDLARAYRAPSSVLNAPITAQRLVATQSYEVDRFKTLATKLDTTVNDVVLAVCSGGLRTHLSEIDALPRQPLVAGLPVSVRQSDSDCTGTALSFALTSLATDISDERERVETITSSASSAKQLLGSIPRSAIDYYTMMLMAPLALSQIAGVGHWGAPIFNLAISNVTGPKRPLYFHQAQVEEMHPVSVVLTGQALNITAFSYADRLSLSFTACRDVLPHVQRLSVACEDALAELEKTFT